MSEAPGDGGTAAAGARRAAPGPRRDLKGVARGLLSALHLDGLYALWHRAARLDPRRLRLAARFRRWNRGARQDEIVVRPGLRLRIDPRSREPFEWFCFRSVEMARELDAFARAMPCRRRFLDIGACHGIFALAFAHGRPGVRAVAVEPSAIAHEILAANIALAGLGNIEPRQVACGAAAGSLRMRQVWHHLEAVPEEAAAPDGAAGAAGSEASASSDGAAGADRSHGAAGPAGAGIAAAAEPAAAAVAGAGGTLLDVPMRSVDNLCAELGFRPDLVKVDVEGYELGVLRGAREILGALQPLLFLELHPDHLRRLGHSPRQVVELLAGLGYRFRGLGGEPLDGARVAALSRVSRIVCAVPGRGGCAA